LRQCQSRTLSFEKFVQAANSAGSNDKVRIENWEKAVAIAEKGSTSRLVYAEAEKLADQSEEKTFKSAAPAARK